MTNDCTFPNYTITPEQTQHAEYRARLSEEIEAGNSLSLTDLRERAIEHPIIVEYKTRIAGGDSSCATYESWLDRLLTPFAPRHRCLSLGAGQGRIEKHFVEKRLCGSFEALDVCFEEISGTQTNSEGVSTNFMDLNFSRLKPDTYDLILCHGVLHHLINLEFLFDQINAALKPDGVVLIYEYVGERQWQFSDERMTMLRRQFPQVRFKNFPKWAVEGFESVRSDELPRLIHSVFGSATVHSRFFGGIYFPFLTCSTVKHDSLLEKVVALDDEFSASGKIAPCYHVGLYGKTNNKAPRATPWTDEMLAGRLRRDFPTSENLSRTLRRSSLGPLLRKIKRTVVR